MRNLKLLAAVLVVAVLVIGVALLFQQNNTSNKAVVTTNQTANTQLASKIDPPKKKLQRVGNTPLFTTTEKQPVRTPLKLKSKSSNNGVAKKQGQSKLDVIQGQATTGKKKVVTRSKLELLQKQSNK